MKAFYLWSLSTVAIVLALTFRGLFALAIAALLCGFLILYAADILRPRNQFKGRNARERRLAREGMLHRW